MRVCFRSIVQCRYAGSFEVVSEEDGSDEFWIALKVLYRRSDSLISQLENDLKELGRLGVCFVDETYFSMVVIRRGNCEVEIRIRKLFPGTYPSAKLHDAMGAVIPEERRCGMRSTIDYDPPAKN